MPVRLLVTGGAGYIGGFATRLLRREGHGVTVVDNLTTGHAAAAGDAELVVGDSGDRQFMYQALRDRRTEAVLHFAGLKSVADSWREPERYLEVNVHGTTALLQAMAEAGVGLLVYSGTCAVYGTPNRVPVGEDEPASPLNPYGQSKWLAEQEIDRAHRAAGIRFCVLRYFNAAGAEADGSAGEDLTAATNLVPMVMKTALGRLPAVPVFGTDYPTPDGTAVRDYVHVLDLAAAHTSALHYLEAGGEPAAFNVGTGVGTSVRELIAAVEHVTGHSIPVKEQGRREGDPGAIWADATRANERLGWRARYGIDDIVASAWRWHISHPQGYE